MIELNALEEYLKVVAGRLWPKQPDGEENQGADKIVSFVTEAIGFVLANNTVNITTVKGDAGSGQMK